ncbi:MAG: hypothetical protein DCC58_09840 [Chloroflexi bacterium]|nr:MAG: hypothetical protein DCC58_09840 [Chloroflexota bacterium]
MPEERSTLPWPTEPPPGWPPTLPWPPDFPPRAAGQKTCIEFCLANGGHLATCAILCAILHGPIFPNGAGTTSLPPTPSSPLRPLPVRRCRVKATLLRVTHSGNDEGDDWRIQTTIQGREVRFRQRSIGYHDTSAFGQEVYNEELGYCSSEVTIDIVCKATEVDSPDPDEVGSATTQVKIRCPSQEIISIPVTVDSAVMTFVLNLEASC